MQVKDQQEQEIVKKYIGEVPLKTTKGRFTFQQKEIAAIDILLFEDKKIDPLAAIAGARAIGFLPACEWFISNCYDMNGQPVTAKTLNEIVLEVPHLLLLVQAVGRGMILIDFHDGEMIIEESDEFTVKIPLSSIEGEEPKYEKVVHVKRLPIGWKQTPQYLSAQTSKDWVKINVDIITKYFEIDGEKWTEEEMRSPGSIDIRIFNTVMRRLGKFLSAG